MKKRVLLNDPEGRRTEIALFRHSLVSSLDAQELSRGEMSKLLRAVAGRSYLIPGRGGKGRVSMVSLRRWLKAFRDGGVEALKPRLRGDYGHSRTIPEAWLLKAAELRQEVPSRSAVVLVEILKRLPNCPAISPSTLDKALRRRGQTCRQMGTRKTRARRWTAAHVNDLWQGDAAHGLWLPDPKATSETASKKPTMRRTKLFVWIDDVSRLVVWAEFFYDEKLPRMERALKMALLRRGVPQRLYTDNGSVFVSAQFAAAMADLGIRRIRSRAGQPRGRGKVERMIRTLQQQFYPEAEAANFQHLADLNEALWAWLECVYHKRRHSETKQAPVDAWRQGIAHVRPADPTVLARVFRWRLKRRVSRTGFVSLLGNSYSVDPSWSGRTIELRFDPFDLSVVEVYRDARPVAHARVEKLARGHVLEMTPVTPAVPLEPSGVNFLDALRREYRRELANELGDIPFRTALEGDVPGEEAASDGW